MQEISEVANGEETVEQSAQEENSRRIFLGRAAVAGLGLAALRLLPSAEAAMMPKQPEADTGHNYPMAKPGADVRRS